MQYRHVNTNTNVAENVHCGLLLPTEPIHKIKLMELWKRNLCHTDVHNRMSYTLYLNWD